MSQISQVSRIALWSCSLNVFVFVIVFVSVFVIVIVSLFGLVMSPHHSDQMLQRSQVSGVPLWRCSLNVFVIVFVFVFIFVSVFFIVFFWSGYLSSSLWSNVSKVKSLSGNSRLPIELFWKATWPPASGAIKHIMYIQHNHTDPPSCWIGISNNYC